MQRFIVALFMLFVFFGCSKTKAIVNGIDESQANEIIVFLSSKNIKASKVLMPVSTTAGANQSRQIWNIEVDPKQTIEAMAILKSVGLPRRQSQTLLDLFSDTGLMTSDRQEQIRYQSGLELDLANMIKLIDGVVDVVVKLSIPQQQAIGIAPSEQPRPTASVFVKHSGILDDPNSHLVTKIKRLVSSAVNDLTVDNVTVVSDLSRFTSVKLPSLQTKSGSPSETVSIWSVEMTAQSASKFRSLFALLCTLIIFFVLVLGFVIWKIYPLLKGGGLKKLFSIKEALNPIEKSELEESSKEENE